MQLGRYQLLTRIASGGMADVFKAKLIGIEGFEKNVAIKKILPHWSSNREFIDMLVDEARILLYLTHANIVQVFELGLEADTYFLVMEYVDGVDLRKFQNKLRELNDTLSTPVVLYIAKEIARGLQYAHEKCDKKKRLLKIVHRDISPQNILLGFEGDIKIADFGIAKVMGKSHETAAGTLKGKFAYMSPEQAIGAEVNAQTDLFALGILLFEMATGQRCFKGETDIETLEAVKKANVVFPPEKEALLPDGLKKIILKLLQRDLGERYQSAADVIDDILHLELVIGASGAREELILLLKKGFSALQDLDSEPTTIAESPQESETIIRTETDIARKTMILVGKETEKTDEVMDVLPTPIVMPQVDEKRDQRFLSPILFGFISLLVVVAFVFIFKGLFLKTAVAPTQMAVITKQDSNKIVEKLELVKGDQPKTPQPVNPLVTPLAKQAEKNSGVVVDPKIKMADINFLAFYEIKAQPEGATIRVRSDVKKSSSAQSSIRQDMNLDGPKSFFVSVEKTGYMPQTFRFTLDKNNPSYVNEVVLTKAAFGRLQVGASPWGRVSIPGIVANSEVPFDRAKLPAGTYTLKVIYPPTNKTVTKSVTIKANESIHCQANFEKRASIFCQ